MPTQYPVKPKKQEMGLLASILVAAAITAAAIAWASSMNQPQTALLQTNVETQ